VVEPRVEHADARLAVEVIGVALAGEAHRASGNDPAKQHGIGCAAMAIGGPREGLLERIDFTPRQAGNAGSGRRSQAGFAGEAAKEHGFVEGRFGIAGS
jgi:hypothetical protein